MRSRINVGEELSRLALLNPHSFSFAYESWVEAAYATTVVSGPQTTTWLTWVIIIMFCGSETTTTEARTGGLQMSRDV